MKALSLAPLALLVVLAGCKEAPPPAAIVRPVLSEVVAPAQPLGADFVGLVQARESTRAAFRLGGRLVARDVSVGDQVAEGQVLAKLDSAQLSFAVDTARAGLASAKAQYDNAATAAKRVQALYEAGTAPKATLDQAQQQVAAAHSAVVQGEATLTQAQDQLDQATLKAAFAGVVTRVSAEPGQVVGAGQPIVTIAKPNARDVVIDVPERIVRQLSQGAGARVWPQLAPASVTSGTVREIAPEADATTRLWQVTIGIDNPPASFWLGTTASVRFDRDRKTRLTVPETAIRTGADGPEVWVIDPQSLTVSARAITTGAHEDGRVVISAGLKAGERIAIAGAHTLEEGQKVRLEGQTE